jgi:single-strand DNA-binding protein
MFLNPKNTSIFVGNLGKDPEERETSGGKTFARFSIALNERGRDADGERTTLTTWVPLTLFGASVEPFLEYVAKGDQVLIYAKYHTYEFEKEGETRYGHGFNVVSWEKLSSRNGASGRDEEEDEEGEEEYAF